MKTRMMATWLMGMVLVAATGCQSGASGGQANTGADAQAKVAAGNEGLKVAKAVLGQTSDGREVQVYTLTNAHGMQARIMTLGATLLSLQVPDKQGRLVDVVLGYRTIDGYAKDEKTTYFGVTVGRYGNRIAKGKFTLDGKEYTLAANNSPNHLHGGKVGFNKLIWIAEPIQGGQGVGVKFSYVGRDGEEGYPGNLHYSVTYQLNNRNELRLEYEATTDQATPINMTHHSYFNLDGQGDSDILGHRLMLTADKYTPVDETLIPTGELRPVAGTPFDFTSPHTIGERIAQAPGGYDHNFVLRNQNGPPALAARVVGPRSGRVMEVWTTEPGVQFYSGNFLDGSITGKDGKVYQKNYGFCLETQHYPDSPNQPNFPSVILRPGETYKHTCIYAFSAP